MIKMPNSITIPQPQKDWTFLVYMAGDNNLEGAGIDDITEMEQAGGSNDNVNVVVQFDRIRGYDPSNENWSTTKRFYITHGSSPDKIESIELEDLRETNCGDPKVLETFLIWGVMNFPAKHYAIILWNHGMGWKDDDIYRLAAKRIPKFRNPFRKPSRTTIINFRRDHARRALFEKSILGSLVVETRGIAYDDTNRDFIDNLELEKVLSKVRDKINRKIDILGMDACLMAMIEVVYQCKDYVDYIVASEETEPEDGWPYEQIINVLNSNPKMAPEKFSKAIVKEYIKSYPNRKDTTQSSIHTANLENLVNVVSELATSLTNNIDQYEDNLQTIITEVKSYHDWEYVDLKDFASRVKNHIPEVANKAKTVIELIDEAVVECGGNGAGLSIYLPFTGCSKLYHGLDWAKETKWDEFIIAYDQRELGLRKFSKYFRHIRERRERDAKYILPIIARPL